MKKIHERMPVILTPKSEQKWLAQNDQKKLLNKEYKNLDWEKEKLLRLKDPH